MLSIHWKENVVTSPNVSLIKLRKETKQDLAAGKV